MKKHSVKIAGHLTSISLEEPFWLALKAIAAAENLSLNALITRIDGTRGDHNLSSALRMFVLQDMQQRLASRQAD